MHRQKHTYHGNLLGRLIPVEYVEIRVVVEEFGMLEFRKMEL